MGEFDGKVVAVTGSAQGIGFGVAKAFADAGATVVVSDLEQGAVDKAASEVGGTGIVCDVTSEEQQQALVAHAVDTHGGLDVMVANAGIARLAPLAQMSFEDWRAVLSVNLDGVFLSLKSSVPALAQRPGSSFVAIASVTAFGGCALIGNYAAAKAGVVNLVKTAAIELRDAGIRVNAVCPGFADTELVRENKSTFEEVLGIPDFDAVINQTQGRYGTPEDVAKAALFAASDRARFTTGAAFTLDGGLTASLV